MRHQLIQGTTVLACLLLAASGAAQEIVHAVSGTVAKVDPQANTIQINTDDGSEGLFNAPSHLSTPVSFNKDVKDGSTPADQFNKPNDEVILYFYGDQSVRTAVAVQDLGPGPFVKAEGTVVKVNKHDHTVTIKAAQGKAQTFHLDPKAVADGPDGAMQADRFDPEKGDDLHIVARQANGTATALFLYE